MSELSELITAMTSAAVVAGAGITWLSKRLDRKAAKAKREADEAKRLVDKRFDEIETKLKACEAREIESLARRGKHLGLIEMLIQEVKRLAKGELTPVLTRARRILKDLKDDVDAD